MHDLRGGSAPALRWSEGLPDAVRAARFDATGALVAAVSARSDVRVYEAANGAVLAARDGLGDAVGAVAVHGPSAQVVVGGRWSLRAWCWRTGEVRGLAGTDA
ncbi:MAG: hypothetical protein H6745_08895 [Deltaproteobacteria bacterium]|nr:hypothetical protein [Deltaproteobacteria bacterium]